MSILATLQLGDVRIALCTTVRKVRKFLTFKYNLVCLNNSISSIKVDYCFLID